MLRYLFALLILIHGLIHFMGFVKAFGYGTMAQLTKSISKPAGMLWLVTAILFIMATVLFLLKKEIWPIIIFIAIIISQVLIISVWKDAKWGTFANFIMMIVAIAGFAGNQFESSFRKNVQSKLSVTNNIKMDLLTKEDIQYLPLPVQQYIRFSEALNQPKVKNVKVVMYGEMRSKKMDWFKFKTVQYNFFDNPSRLFFMKAKMYGFEVPGYHRYENETARMQVKLFGLFPVMQAKGHKMDLAETVTLFNDMCLMAPATLIDKRIQWESIDSLSVKATFTNGINKITATLYFNEHGQLVNFISDDRYDIGDMKRYRFSTPVKKYQLLNGRNVISLGEAIWHYTEGEFVYGKFYLKDIEYNVTECP